MARKIISEFESVDMAENAARDIRKSFDGIQNIKILARKNVIDTVGSINAMSGNYGSGYFGTTGVYNTREEFSPYRETNWQRKAFIQITVESNKGKGIESKLTNLGGIDTKIEYFSKI